jgi:para-nitrobenzyl esterase
MSYSVRAEDTIRPKREHAMIRPGKISRVSLSSLLVASLAGCATGEQSKEKKHLMSSETDKVALTEIVQTKSGRLRGESRDGVFRFLGIPYAQNIAGKNRFAPPQPVAPWTDVREAVRYAESSPQQSSEMSTPVTAAFAPPDYVKPGDNCLALNVWAPAQAEKNLPVMVWLHGGGWTSGSGSCGIYDGENLARRGNVVLVTVNHRLGASGLTDFSRVLGREFVDSSNLGIRDMVAALQWVHDNIATFGGNPDLVTLFGESGGGWKVATLMGVPSAKGLFHRAIIQSGPLTRFMTPDKADEVARAVCKALDVTPETADKLNKISTEEIVAAEAQVLAGMRMSMQSPGFPSGFWPVIDGEMIPAHVFDPKAAPCSLDVPLLVGQNGTEFTLFMLRDQAAYALDDTELQQRVTMTFGEDAAPQILGTYRRDFPDSDPSGLWFRLFSDYAMGTLSSEIMDVRSAPGAAPVYAYRFDWQTPILDGKLHSPHTIEIPFVFNNVSTGPGIAMTEGRAEAAALAEKVSSAWVEFARTGKPAAEGLPKWPAFTTEHRESMHLDTESRVAPYMDPAIVKQFHDRLWTQAGLK